jgi:hypothetical protein
MVDYYSARKHIADWLNQLATIVPKAMEITDIAAKIDQLADLLVSKVPTTLFDTDSLEFCARRFKFWPTYADLWARLQTWQRERPKEQKALPAPEGVEINPSLNAQDRALVRSWWNLRAENIANGTLATALDVQRRWPAVFREICNTDTEAAAIAVKRGWAREAESADSIDARQAAEWGPITPGFITEKVAELREAAAGNKMGAGLAAGLLSFLRTAVAKHAPQHLHLIPDRLAEPERQRSTPDRYEQARIEVAETFAKVQAQNKPAPISPEQLAAIRDANPQVQRARQTAEQLRRLDEAAEADAPHDRKLRVVPDEPEDTPRWTPPWETESAA